MALQDLTPQLRTRLSRVERAVGLFVTLATLLLAAGFAYYIYVTAERKGWFKAKIEYSTSLNNAAGLKVGDPVKLMGFSVGEISRVEPEPPNAYYGVTVFFRVMEPYYGYIWLDSKVRVAAADFLGNRNLEILKGYNGAPTVLEADKKPQGILNRAAAEKALLTLSNEVFAAELIKARNENPTFNEHSIEMEALLETKTKVTGLLNDKIQANLSQFYKPLPKAGPYWITPLESPALTDRLETVVTGIESALPNILNLTNQLTGTLTQAEGAVTKLNLLLEETRPTITNLAVITGNLKNPEGSLGKWLLPTNLTIQLEQTLASADETLRAADVALKTADKALLSTDTNLTSLVSNLNLSLLNIASLTSNLNAQVQSNTNILSGISSAVTSTDELVQGLQRHWLLRSAFKTNKTEKARPERVAPAPRSRR